MVVSGNKVCYNGDKKPKVGNFSGSRNKQMTYLGEYRVTLDDKGRMRIPNKIKSQLGSNTVTICAGTDHCLFLMTEKEFSEKIIDLAEETPFKAFPKQKALRMFSSTVFVPEEDAQGRFVLPQKLKAYSGIDKKIVFLGAIDRVEIWSEEAYEAEFGLDEININSAVEILGI